MTGVKLGIRIADNQSYPISTGSILSLSLRKTTNHQYTFVNIFTWDTCTLCMGNEVSGINFQVSQTQMAIYLFVLLTLI